MRLAAILSAAFLFGGQAWAGPEDALLAEEVETIVQQAAGQALEAALEAVDATSPTVAAEQAPTPRPNPHPARLANAGNWTVYHGATELQVRNAVAVLRVTPEARTGVAVSIENAGPLPTPRVFDRGRRVVVDGSAGRIRSCSQRGPVVERVGQVNWANAPVIHVRLPADAVISASGAVRTSIGPMQSARLSFQGCGDAVFGSIAGDLTLALTGSGDVQGGSARSAAVSLAGSGDVVIGEVRDGLTVSVAGAGDVRTGAIRGGDVRVVLQGAGDVLLGSGEAGDVTVILAGAGDVSFPGRARSLDALVAGAGDVRVGRVTGEVRRRVVGGGDVTVGGR